MVRFHPPPPELNRKHGVCIRALASPGGARMSAYCPCSEFGCIAESLPGESRLDVSAAVASSLQVALRLLHRSPKVLFDDDVVAVEDQPRFCVLRWRGTS